jgi:hypothetical protein
MRDFFGCHGARSDRRQGDQDLYQNRIGAFGNFVKEVMLIGGKTTHMAKNETHFAASCAEMG